MEPPNNGYPYHSSGLPPPGTPHQYGHPQRPPGTTPRQPTTPVAQNLFGAGDHGYQPQPHSFQTPQPNVAIAEAIPSPFQRPSYGEREHWTTRTMVDKYDLLDSRETCRVHSISTDKTSAERFLVEATTGVYGPAHISELGRQLEIAKSRCKAKRAFINGHLKAVEESQIYWNRQMKIVESSEKEIELVEELYTQGHKTRYNESKRPERWTQKTLKALFRELNGETGTVLARLEPNELSSRLGEIKDEEIDVVFTVMQNFKWNENEHVLKLKSELRAKKVLSRTTMTRVNCDKKRTIGSKRFELEVLLCQINAEDYTGYYYRATSIVGSNHLHLHDNSNRPTNTISVGFPTQQPSASGGQASREAFLGNQTEDNKENLPNSNGLSSLHQASSKNNFSFGFDPNQQVTADTVFGSDSQAGGSNNGFSFGFNPNPQATADNVFGSDSQAGGSKNDFSFGFNPNQQATADNVFASDSQAGGSKNDFSFGFNPNQQATADNVFGSHSQAGSNNNFSFGFNPNQQATADNVVGSHYQQGESNTADSFNCQKQSAIIPTDMDIVDKDL